MTNELRVDYILCQGTLAGNFEALLSQPSGNELVDCVGDGVRLHENES